MNASYGIVQGNKAWSNAGSFGCGIKSYGGRSRYILGNEVWSNGTGIDVNADTATTAADISVSNNEIYTNTVGLFVSDEITAPELGGNHIHDNTGNVTINAATYRMGGILFDASTHLPVSVSSITGLTTNLSTAASAPAVLVASDSFNRADSSAGSLGSVDNSYGGTVVPAWVVDSQIKVKGNQMGADSLTATRYATVDAARTDVRIKATLSVATGGGGLVARFTDLNNHYLLEVTSAGVMSIKKRISGTNSSALATASATIVSGDVIEFSVQGSTLKAYRNGAVVATATDTAITTGTRHGVRSAFSDATWRMDDFYLYDK